jgi:hypothetical protein
MTVSEEEVVMAVRRFSLRPVAVDNDNSQDVWNPDASDMSVVLRVWMLLGTLCLLVVMVIAKKRGVRV